MNIKFSKKLSALLFIALFAVITFGSVNLALADTLKITPDPITLSSDEPTFQLKAILQTNQNECDCVSAKDKCQPGECDVCNSGDCDCQKCPGNCAQGDCEAGNTCDEGACDCDECPENCYPTQCDACNTGNCDCTNCPGNCSGDECSGGGGGGTDDSEDAGGLVPCGRLTGSAEEQGLCRLCHFFILLKRIVDFIFGLLVFAAILVITIAGIFYLISAGSPEMINRAKAALRMTLTGFALALVAWLLINYFIIIIGAKEGYGITKINVQNWHMFNIECDVTPYKDKYFDQLDSKYTPVNYVTPGQADDNGVMDDNNPTDCSVPDKDNICSGYSCSVPCSVPSQYDDIIKDVASRKAYDDIGVTENFIKRVICDESSGVSNTKVAEPPGTGRCSCGLMQVNVAGGCSGSQCQALMDPRTAIEAGVKKYYEKYKYAQKKMDKYKYDNVTIHEMAVAYYVCCGTGLDVNTPSNDCNSGNGWPLTPKWGCNINTGGKFGMCFVKNLACRRAACADDGIFDFDN